MVEDIFASRHLGSDLETLQETELQCMLIGMVARQVLSLTFDEVFLFGSLKSRIVVILSLADEMLFGRVASRGAGVRQ